MDIVRCDRSHGEAWNAFVSSTTHASFYHRFEWRDINERCLGHDSCYLAAFDQNRMVGLFPLVHVKSRLFGNIACSLPFVNYGGPAGEDESIDDLLIAEAARSPTSGTSSSWRFAAAGISVRISQRPNTKSA